MLEQSVVLPCVAMRQSLGRPFTWCALRSLPATCTPRVPLTLCDSVLNLPLFTCHPPAQCAPPLRAFTTAPCRPPESHRFARHHLCCVHVAACLETVDAAYAGGQRRLRSMWSRQRCRHDVRVRRIRLLLCGSESCTRRQATAVFRHAACIRPSSGQSWPARRVGYTGADVAAVLVARTAVAGA
jgi:hypothetical protein